jgi:ubiquitin C-terminal hydrolase
MKSFGLRNQRGSCWVNAALQAVFRIPDLQQRFQDEKHDTTNPVEVCLHSIWSSSGATGLKDLYAVVNTTLMPAGEGIGDSHELLEFLCDKVPMLDKLFRFSVENRLKCNNCSYTDGKRESMIEFPIVPSKPKETVVDAIVAAAQPHAIPDWTCEKCKGKGCTKQFLLAGFPKILAFHVTSLRSTVTYSSILSLNKIEYALFAVVCYDGGHWWTYGRDMPPGKSWVTYNDEHVRSHGPQQFPMADTMRLLMYYRLN